MEKANFRGFFLLMKCNNLIIKCYCRLENGIFVTTYIEPLCGDDVRGGGGGSDVDMW